MIYAGVGDVKRFVRKILGGRVREAIIATTELMSAVAVTAGVWLAAGLAAGLMCGGGFGLLLALAAQAGDS